MNYQFNKNYYPQFYYSYSYEQKKDSYNNSKNVGFTDGYNKAVYDMNFRLGYNYAMTYNRDSYYIPQFYQSMNYNINNMRPPPPRNINVNIPRPQNKPDLSDLPPLPHTPPIKTDKPETPRTPPVPDIKRPSTPINITNNKIKPLNLDYSSDESTISNDYGNNSDDEMSEVSDYALTDDESQENSNELLSFLKDKSSYVISDEEEDNNNMSVESEEEESEEELQEEQIEKDNNDTLESYEDDTSSSLHYTDDEEDNRNTKRRKVNSNNLFNVENSWSWSWLNNK